MSLLGSLDIAALAYDDKAQKLYGVRLRQKSRNDYEIVKCASSENASWQRAADSVLKELSVNNSVYLILAMMPEQSEVFEVRLPHVSTEVMRDALRFEVPRQLLSVPEDFRLQFVQVAPVDENSMVKVRCAVFPESSLHKMCNQIAPLRNKPDVMINPLLTLPDELPVNAAVKLPFMADGFCWKNGSWQIAGSDDGNIELDEILQAHCSGGWQAEYRTAVMAAIYGGKKLFVRNSVLSGVVVLPNFLRPARFRTQLRVMALLAILLVGVNLFRYAGDFMASFREHSRLSAQVNNLRGKVQDMRKKVKSGEKQLKEMQRTAELKLGSRECLGYLGYLSEKLPDDVLLANFRWNEGNIDMNLQTMSTEIDLVSFVNRLPGFKVLSASQRTNPSNNFTNANVKLSIIEPPALPVKKNKSKKAKAKK